MMKSRTTILLILFFALVALIAALAQGVAKASPQDGGTTFGIRWSDGSVETKYIEKQVLTLNINFSFPEVPEGQMIPFDMSGFEGWSIVECSINGVTQQGCGPGFGLPGGPEGLAQIKFFFIENLGIKTICANVNDPSIPPSCVTAKYGSTIFLPLIQR